MEFTVTVSFLVCVLSLSHPVSAYEATGASLKQPEGTTAHITDARPAETTNSVNVTESSTAGFTVTDKLSKTIFVEETINSSDGQSISTSRSMTTVVTSSTEPTDTTENTGIHATENTGTNTTENTWTQTTETMGTQTTENTGTQTTENMGTQSTENTGTNTTENTGTQTTETMGTQTTENTGTQTTENMGTQSTENMGTQTTENMGTQTTGNTGTQTIENTGTQSTENMGTQTTENTGKQTTELASTDEATTKSTSGKCMKSRKEEFKFCLESLGNNAIKYIATQNLTGFINDICDPEMSKPHMECIKRLFRECPDFLERPEVTALEFGPYHIKDIHYFDTVDQMCRCSSGLVCINKLLETKRSVQLTISKTDSPWTRMPNFTAICEYDTARYIGCVRRNLRRCQSALIRRYGEMFTHSDAEELKGMYDFTMVHCDTVKHDDFEEKYRCIEKASRSPEMNACVRRADRLTIERQTCEIRECVKTVLEPVCDDDMISLYIDSVNIYTHSGTKLLNFPCSSAADIGLSIVTVVVTFVIVLFY